MLLQPLLPTVILHLLLALAVRGSANHPYVGLDNQGRLLLQSPHGPVHIEASQISCGKQGAPGACTAHSCSLFASHSGRQLNICCARGVVFWPDLVVSLPSGAGETYVGVTGNNSLLVRSWHVHVFGNVTVCDRLATTTSTPTTTMTTTPTTTTPKPPTGRTTSDPAFSCRHIHRDYPELGSGPFYILAAGTVHQVQCDMANDGGGWTKVASSLPDSHTQSAWGDLLPLKAQQHLLESYPDVIWRVSVSAVASAARMFINDTRPCHLYPSAGKCSFHLWNSDASVPIWCKNTLSGVWRSANKYQVSCLPWGVGVHTCGQNVGWILLHQGMAYNRNGQHPCPVGQGTSGQTGPWRVLWML